MPHFVGGQQESSEPASIPVGMKNWTLSTFSKEIVSNLCENTLEIATEHRQHKLTSGCGEKAVTWRTSTVIEQGFSHSSYVKTKFQQ